MNQNNQCQLSGTVHGDCWTCWRPGQSSRGQVRFEIDVSRDGAEPDVFLCAIEPRNAEQIKTLERELTTGRTVTITAEARAMGVRPPAAVIFIAEECLFDGLMPIVDQAAKRSHARGKLAAAGDVEESGLFELSKDRS